MEGRGRAEERRGSTGMTTGEEEGASGLSAPERTICFMKRTREREGERRGNIWTRERRRPCRIGKRRGERRAGE